MDKIIDRLWVGDQNDGRNPDALRSAGITAVMNATPETDSLGGQFLYLRLNQQDGQPIPIETLDGFLGWMKIVMARGSMVLIHCGAGVSRAASFAIAWLMDCGFSWDEAETLVRSKRAQASPNPVLKQSIVDYFRLTAIKSTPTVHSRGGTMADEPEQPQPEQPTEGPVVEESAAPADEPRIGLIECPSCGVNFTTGESVCPNCGTTKPT